ncbi:MAG: cellulase family glycosylhydrolase [Chitinispirillia bacterium]|nr:cellulase family glycosylhydrolase [Chitinispirillia bacterium]MCL2241845.1 cellulase family glycosylhydrolase [Chitinispirillia bacterium]
MILTNRLVNVIAIVALLALAALAGPVEEYGRLMASGNKIIGENSGGEAVQLKGPSFPWSVSQWGTDRFFITAAVDAMIDGWNAQIIRAPLGISYVSPPDYNVSHGYDIAQYRQANWERVRRVADRAVERGVYAIVDWHSYSTHDTARTALAIDFFTNDTLAGKYGNNPAVIFEIYNEPIGPVSDWGEPGSTGPVKTYAETVIKAIRDAGFNNLIIVGNPAWASVPDVVAANPPKDPSGEVFDNIAITMHVYAHDHQLNGARWVQGTTDNWVQRGTYRSAVINTLNAGFPVFITEWGTTDGPGTQTRNFPQADLWVKFMDSLKISACAWNVMAEAESASLLAYWLPSTSPLSAPGELGSWTDPARMTPHGRYIYRWLTGKDTTWAPDVDRPFEGKASPMAVNPNWYTDVNPGGSTVTQTVNNGEMHAEYSIVTGDYPHTPYIVAGFDVANAARCAYGIGYSYKGVTHALRIEQSDVTDYAFHESPAQPAAADWTTTALRWSDFAQPSWGAAVTTDSSLVGSIAWYIRTGNGSSGDLWVKDVLCLGDPGGEIVQVKHTGSRQNANINQYVKVSGRTMQVRLTDDSKVDVYTLNGKRVQSMDLRRGSHSVRMNNLPRGMYIISVTGKTTAATQSVRRMVK